tara:strand:+ start:144253 stop:145812 length:1560 start_codon:yes stop_codon:yes gene_type:complete
MPQITLPKSFFTKERDNLYSDWRTAFWREDFQNSIDAGATEIRISFEQMGDDLAVEFIDNGCGMTRDVIENVFFALGETTKTGSTTGGFGRARILTCFAMGSYEFWTGNLHVTGDGANYNINDNQPHVSGCRFRVVINNETAEKMRTALKKVLLMSQMSCHVFVDGERWTNWLHKRRLVKTASYGSIHVNKNGQFTNQVIVRVNGLWMYSIYCEAKAQVIVEIDPTKSREVLTVNRDGMHYNYSNDLQSFINELAVDTRSALRARRRKTRLIEGTGVHTTSRPIDIPQNDWEETAPSDTISVGNNVAVAAGGTIAAAIQVNRAQSVHANEVESEIIKGEQIETGLPAIYINDETDPMDLSHAAVRKIIDNFDPTRWVHAVKKVRGHEQPYRKGANYLKLLIAWEACCLEAIKALLNTDYAPQQLRWLVGWTFSFEDGACHVGLSEGHALCLNPVKKDGKLRYKTRDRSDQIRLMALAKHEVAHVIVGPHNEDYAAVLTAIDSHFDAQSCFKAIRQALAA